MRLFVIALLILLLSAAHALELDVPPKDNQVGYAPASGSVVSLNPPPFTWVPPEKHLTYCLEIASDVDFKDVAVRVEGIPISTYALREPLAAGAYYWRYGVLREGEAPLYSHVRHFTVPEGAQEFPYPDLDAAMASIPKARPRMFVTADKLAAYRQRAKAGDLKVLAEAVVRSYSKHIGEELVPEPPYVTGEGAERGLNYAKIFRSTRPPMDVMEGCALAYLLTGDAALGGEAKRRILYFFGEWDAEGSTAFKHNDEPAMWVMMRGIRAYDWTYDLFTPEERAVVEPVMKIRAAQFYDHLLNRRQFHTHPYASHSGRTIGFLGEACIAFAHEWPEAKTWMDYVLTNYWNIYPAWGKEDGGWHEGPGYYTAYMSFALHFVVPLREATGIDLMEKPFFKNTPYYLLYSHPPYAKHAAFGDGESAGSSAGKGQLMYQFSTLLQNPELRWYADWWKTGPGNGILGAVLTDLSLTGVPPYDLPEARYFPGVGLVSLHSDFGRAEQDVHFLIHSDPYGAISHAHADQNAFTLEAYGEALAICSGFYPWYGSDHHRNWQWESKSSNTITVDGGLGQKIRSAQSKGRITAFHHDADYDYVAADATAAYPDRLDRFVRQVVHVRPGIFVMRDDLAAPKPVTYEWRLHTWEEMALDQAAQQVTVARGDARLAVHFLHPSAMQLEQTKGFDYPPEQKGSDQFHLVASTPEPVEATSVLTVLSPYTADAGEGISDVALLQGDGALGVAFEMGGMHIVGFRTGDTPGAVTLGPCETDAAVFSAALDENGAVMRSFMQGGTYLKTSDAK